MENRRGWIRGLALVVTGAWAAMSSKAAETRISVGRQIRGAPNTLAGFDATGQGQSVTVGAGLTLNGAMLTAAGGATTPVRSRNVVLVRDASGTYALPAGVQKNTVLHRNGLRQLAAGDYNIVSGVVIPIGSSWPADDIVLADGETA